MSTTVRDNPAMHHTEVEPGYGGRGLGDELARAALADVRGRCLVLVPLCPFIAAYIRRHPAEYLDLVAPSLKGRVMEGAGQR
jgi:uncharacterized protein